MSACATSRSGLSGQAQKAKTVSIVSPDRVDGTDVPDGYVANFDGYLIARDTVDLIVEANLNTPKLRAALERQSKQTGANPLLVRAFRSSDVDKDALRAYYTNNLISIATLDSRFYQYGLTTDEQTIQSLSESDLEALTPFFAPTSGKVKGAEASSTSEPSAFEELHFSDLPEDLSKFARTTIAHVIAVGLDVQANVAEAPLKLAKSLNGRASKSYCFRHILIATNNGQPDDTGVAQPAVTAEQALAKAQEVRAKIEGGADFGETAKTDSQDPGSASNGGSYGCVSDLALAQYVFEFAEGIRLAEVGKVSEPVKTDFGYHLIKVDEIKTLTDDELKAEADQSLQPPAAGEAIAGASWMYNLLPSYAIIKVAPSAGTFINKGASGQLVIPPGITLEQLEKEASEANGSNETVQSVQP